MKPLSERKKSRILRRMRNEGATDEAIAAKAEALEASSPTEVAPATNPKPKGGKGGKAAADNPAAGNGGGSGGTGWKSN